MMRYLKMMSSDWRYTDDRLKLRGQCLSVLLNKYGSVRIEEQTYTTQDIYECVDTWISQGNKITHGLTQYFEVYFKGKNKTNGLSTG